jgi:hypothetical protein
MKKLLTVSLILLSLLACKKKEFSPEGPTDVRIRNISDLNFQEVIVKTSENPIDIDTLGTIAQASVSDYFRFTKAYSKAEISAKITLDGLMYKFSTGPVDFTYMNYLGRARITFEVYISSINNKELTIGKVIPEEELVLK